MKTILIDDLLENQSTQQEQTVIINGTPFKGYQIAKPLNHEKEYISLEERIAMALKVLKGEAIAVQYFNDLTEEEQVEYVKNKMK